ncbi:hypothetical protein ICU_02327 [Bacillus cereus BAG2X1-1]|nr:hypothetical protein ICU_02327 [Bacillus cereus BAG2X1-1]
MNWDWYELYNVKKLVNLIKLILISPFLKLQIGIKTDLKKSVFIFLQ